MKKVVLSSLISVVILILIAGGIVYFQKFRSESSNALEAVPSDVAWLISCDPASGDLRQLANTGFFSGADSIAVLKDWKKSLLKFDSIAVNSADLKKLFKGKPLYVSGHVTGPRTFSTVYLVNLGSTNGATVLKILQTLLQTKQEPSSRNYNGADIREFTANDGKVNFAYVLSKGVFIGSTTSYLVEDALRQQRSEKIKSPALELEPSLRDAQRKTVISIRYDGFEKWLQTNLVNGAANISELQRLGNWTSLRMDIHTNQLDLSGSTSVSDSAQFLQVFKDQQPVQRKLVKKLLGRTAAFVSWGFSNPALFFSDYGMMIAASGINSWENMSTDSLRKKFASFAGNEMGLVVVKPVNGQSDFHYFTLMSLRNVDSCTATLKKLTQSVSSQSIPEEQYNGTVIRMIPGQGLMPALFGPLYSKISKSYYTILDSTLIVTNQVSALRAYINDYRLNNLLSDDNRFKALEKPLPGSSNVYFYCSIPQSEKLFATVAAPQWTAWLAKYSSKIKSWNGMALAINSQGGVYKTTAGIGYYADTLSVPQTQWRLKLDTSVIAGPFVPANGKFLLVQLTGNTLVAADRKGQILWKKKLESRIQGKIFPVINGLDTTYLFNTSSFAYRLKNDGSSVTGFPVRFSAAATSGMAFLADSIGKDGRFYVPLLNMKLMAYNLKGKPAPGYSPARLRQVVRQAPVILVQQKAIALAGEEKGAYIISYSGAVIHAIRQDVVFASGTSFYADTTSPVGYAWLSPEGNYIRGGKDGIPMDIINITDGDSVTGAERIDLNGDNRPDWLFTMKNGLRGTTEDGVSLFVFTTESGLTSPVVVHASDKTLCGATDGTRIYVFNRNGSLYEGFPVGGGGQPVFIPGSNKEVSIVFVTDNNSLQWMQFQ